MPHLASRFEFRLLYIIGVVQGLALVTFPAASGLFTGANGFALTSTQYGAMFISQVVMAIVASAMSGALASRLGLRMVLQLGLCANLASMVLLAAALFSMRSAHAYVLLCMATGALGLGFGPTTMSINTLVQGFAGQRQDAAMLTLNALIGLGTALAPLLIVLSDRFDAWLALPALMSVSLAGLLLATLRAPLQLPYQLSKAAGGLPTRFWAYVAVVLLYGIAETLTGNWATLYLTNQRGVAPDAAAFALAAFWIMLTVGRIAFALLAGLLPSRAVFVGLPILLAVAFQIVAQAESALFGIAAFALVGFACSAILPLSLSFAGKEFPAQAAAMLGALIAFYQLGYGIAAFGGGPLIDHVGLSNSTVFSLGSVVAIALAVATWLVSRSGVAPASSNRGPIGEPRSTRA